MGKIIEVFKAMACDHEFETRQGKRMWRAVVDQDKYGLLYKDVEKPITIFFCKKCGRNKWIWG